jgi:hypothetical protein
MHPVRDCVAGRLSELEGNRPARFLLDHGRSRPDRYPSDEITQPELHKIATAQLAVDREVEQREVANATIDRQPRSDFPDVLGLRRRLLADDAAGVPGFDRFQILFDVKHGNLPSRRPHLATRLSPHLKDWEDSQGIVDRA